MDIEKIRRAVHNKVCERCIELGADGNCTLTGDRRCGVELYLEQVVEVVRSVKSNKVEDYVRVLREKVCSHCKNQRHDGTCQLRSEADCGLDRYFELMVEAIEECDEESKGRSKKSSP